MATTPQWVFLQNSMRIEFAHTHLHTTHMFSKLVFLILKLSMPKIDRNRSAHRHRVVGEVSGVTKCVAPGGKKLNGAPPLSLPILPFPPLHFPHPPLLSY